MLKENIKKIREANKISQRELARIIGMSGQMISKIERGDTTPSVETIYKIARALNVSPACFLDAECSLSYKLIEAIDKACPKERDFIEDLSCLLGLSNKEISEIIGNPLIDFPLQLQVELLSYFSKINYQAFLNFWNANKDFPYPAEIKEKADEIIFGKPSEKRNPSLFAFKHYIITTFGDKLKDLSKEDINELYEETNSYLEYAIYKKVNKK